jgi:hypothetical protein
MRFDHKAGILVLALVTFGVIAAAVAWIGLGQPHGLIHGIVYGETNFLQRLWPIVVLTILCLGLAAMFVTQGITFRTMTAAPSAKILRASAALPLGGVTTALMAVWALRAFPFSADEYDYLFQAETFLCGRLWNPLLSGHEFFSFLWIVEKAGKWVGSFPPGWPLLLAGAHLLGLPFWLVCPLFGALALFFLARLAGSEDGQAGIVMALALVVFSPFFAFNAGSFYSHVPTASFGLMFCYFGAKFVDAPNWRCAALTGAALGMVGVIRPFDTMIYAAPFSLELLFKAKREYFGAMAVIVLGGIPCLAGLLFYTRAITGSAFLPVQVWAYSEIPIGLGGTNLQGRSISIFQEILFAKTRIWMLAEWSSLIFVLSFLPALAWKTFMRKVRFYDFVMPTGVIAYLFVNTDMGGDQYGPRFYFEGFMLMPLTIGSMIVGLIQARRPVSGAAVAGLTTAHILVCLASLAVLLVYMRKVVDDRFDIYDQVRRAGLHNALVIVHRRDIFARNGLDRDGDVIYALDLPGRINELHRLFPDRQFYLYKRAGPEARGELLSLQPAFEPR